MNRRLTVTVGKTVNLGNYESLRIECSIVQDIADTDNANDAYQEMFECMAQEVVDKIEQSTGE